MILIWFLPLQFISSPFLIGLQIADKQIVITKIAGFLALLNILLNAIFIVLIGGDYVCAGPAIGTLISSFIAVVLIIRTYNNEIKSIDYFAILRKPLISLIASTILFLLLNIVLNSFISAFLAVASYFMLLHVWGEFSIRQILNFFHEMR